MEQHRATIQYIGDALTHGLERALGMPVTLGMDTRWDDPEMVGRPLPLYATLLHLKEPLADCFCAVGSMREDNIRTAMGAMAKALYEAVGLPATPETPEVHEFEDVEIAGEQLDGLWNEPTLKFSTPKGELLVILGMPMVRSVAALQRRDARDHGAADQAAGSGAGTAGSSIHAGAGAEAGGFAGVGTGADAASLADALAAEEAALEFSMGGSSSAPAAELHGGGSAASADEIVFANPGQVASSDGRLQADVSSTDVLASLADYGARAPAEAAPALAAAAQPFAATAAANALAAAPASRHWEQMLSGVDVDVSAELGSASMRLGDITSLVRDSVLTLDQLTDDPVRVYVNGALFATARLVVVNDEYGIEILEVYDSTAARTEHPLAA